ncbi:MULTISPECIES: phosphatidylinositol-specific phospholipase C [Chryseobacterium]|uniref:1-phosphatidylinositol phosphodiesterase n=1 Tax=Chryseobacterium geocarposphaerae TaxID=1416776 RepID=A0ABU1LIB1_9FLAO|nr:MULTISPECIES: phosphatidylinositol-specific phospholipase C [Chryseobacterium]MDR6406467.1 1-phosphatidylinositol phosphodiesterase [Chryseobacterium geocarposphaerae]MDR6699903.1 1-phosphatidylinositol phosphodiesterase [Chryseobacterium ginsenosidimutans]
MNTFTQNWMSNIDGNKKLAELTIPGTHDSATYDTAFMPAQCQTMNFTDQLNSGIRFLDFRLKRGYDADKDHVLWFYHGSLGLNLHFGQVINMLIDFLQRHKDETIIMCVKNEADPSNDSKQEKFYNDFNITISNNYPSYFYRENRIPTLDEVRGKIVFVKRFGTGTVDSSSDGLNLFDKWPNDSMGDFENNGVKYYVQDVYYSWSKGTDRANKFNEFVKSALLNAASGDKDRLYFNFTSGTGATGGILPDTTRPWDLAKVVNPLFFDYLKTYPKGRYGIIPMDYPEYPDYKNLIQSVINTNEFKVAAPAEL